jgi:hypothetical protein
MIPTSAPDLFNRLMSEALARHPDRAREIDTILCFKIGDGAWTIDCSRAAVSPTCTQGSSDKARCTVEIDSTNFLAMLSDPSAGMQLYFQKKLHLSGDPAHALKIAPLFELLRPLP